MIEQIELTAEVIKQIINGVSKSIEYKLDKELEKFKIQESAIYLKKQEIYTDFLKSIKDAINLGKNNQEDQQKMMKEISDNFLNRVNMMFMYVPESIIKKLGELQESNKNNRGLKSLEILGDMVIEMRKDLGYKDTMTGHDYLKMVLSDYHDYF